MPDPDRLLPPRCPDTWRLAVNLAADAIRRTTELGGDPDTAAERVLRALARAGWRLCPPTQQEIVAWYRAGDSTKTDRFRAAGSSVDMVDAGRTGIEFTAGELTNRDDPDNGPVASVQYERALRVLRRLIPREDHRD